MDLDQGRERMGQMAMGMCLLPHIAGHGGFAVSDYSLPGAVWL